MEKNQRTRRRTDPTSIDTPEFSTLEGNHRRGEDRDPTNQRTNRVTDPTRHETQETTRNFQQQNQHPSQAIQNEISRSMDTKPTAWNFNTNARPNGPTTPTSAIQPTSNVGTPPAKKQTRRFENPTTNIVNLSSAQLNTYEKSLLSKGLNYIPTPAPQHAANILKEFLLFERKIRLNHYFRERNNEENEEEPDSDEDPAQLSKILRPSSGWTPINTDPRIESYKTLTLNNIQQALTKTPKPRYNLKLKERKAIKSLKDNPNIVIKPADKGGAIVIMNKEDYVKECLRQLSDKKHYKKLTAEVKV